MRKSFTAAIFAAALAVVSSCATMQSGTGVTHGQTDLGFENFNQDKQTYSVSEIKPDIAASSYSDIWDYIRGKVPGVQVGPSSPGSVPNIVIRGVGTNSGQTQPLFIVDGIEMENVSALSPTDIESVEVLKDASASIYGVRGGNGVILFRTKTAAAAAREAAEREKAEREAAKEARKAAKAAKKSK